MRQLLISILILFVSIQAFGQDNFYDRVDRLMKKYVSDGKVDYAAIKANPQELNDLVEKINKAQVGFYSEEERKAFYINSYNVLVIKGIVMAYPVKSPMDIDGFFDKKKHQIAGESLTLNDIENKKIREVYEDARIHFVLVCAAKGCPQIINSAYRPGTLDAQLNTQTRLSMNNPDFIKAGKSKVEISEIFKWYEADFGGKENFISYINEYRDEKISESASVGHYTYDWALNEKK